MEQELELFLTAKAVDELRSAELAHELATFWRSKDKSAERTFDEVLGTLRVFNREHGCLLDVHGQLIDLASIRPEQLWDRRLLKRSRALNKMRVELWGGSSCWTTIRVDVTDLFGLDVRSTWNKFFVQHCDQIAHGDLHSHLTGRMMFIDFAKRIQLRQFDE